MVTKKYLRFDMPPGIVLYDLEQLYYNPEAILDSNPWVPTNPLYTAYTGSQTPTSTWHRIRIKCTSGWDVIAISDTYFELLLTSVESSSLPLFYTASGDYNAGIINTRSGIYSSVGTVSSPTTPMRWEVSRTQQSQNGAGIFLQNTWDYTSIGNFGDLFYNGRFFDIITHTEVTSPNTTHTRLWFVDVSASSAATFVEQTTTHVTTISGSGIWSGVVANVSYSLNVMKSAQVWNNPLAYESGSVTELHEWEFLDGDVNPDPWGLLTGPIQQPIQFIGNGYLSEDFSAYENTEDLINKIRPSYPWQDYSGEVPDYATEWSYKYVNARPDFTFFYTVSFPEVNAPFMAYDVPTDSYYVDYDLIPEQDLLKVYGFPWYALYPTASVGLLGGMMGPLGVSGTAIPPSIDPEVRLTLAPLILKYGLTKAPSIRRGLFLQKSSGSPQLSLEPVWPTASWHLPGDIWFGDTTGSWRGLIYADYSSSLISSSLVSGTVVPYRIFTTTGARDYIDGGSW